MDVDQTKQGFEQGGLSGAVRADDADDLALVKGQEAPFKMFTPGR